MPMMIDFTSILDIISVDVLAIVQPLLFYLVIFIGVLCTGGMY